MMEGLANFKLADFKKVIKLNRQYLKQSILF